MRNWVPDWWTQTYLSTPHTSIIRILSNQPTCMPQQQTPRSQSINQFTQNLLIKSKTFQESLTHKNTKQTLKNKSKQPCRPLPTTTTTPTTASSTTTLLSLLLLTTRIKHKHKKNKFRRRLLLFHRLPRSWNGWTQRNRKKNKSSKEEDPITQRCHHFQHPLTLNEAKGGPPGSQPVMKWSIRWMMLWIS